MGADRCDIRRNAPFDGARCGDVREQLRAVDFALYETALYLDAYPHSTEALAYYHQLQTERKTLAERYTQLYGPLTQRDHAAQSSWQWVETPWPWEHEAN